MTRKDYERAARLIRETAEEYGPWRQDLVKIFAVFFAGDNPRFDPAGFAKACTPHREPPTTA